MGRRTAWVVALALTSAACAALLRVDDVGHAMEDAGLDAMLGADAATETRVCGADAGVTWPDFTTGNVETFDPSAAAVAPPGSGYLGGAFDGRYMYFAPANKTLPERSSPRTASCCATTPGAISVTPRRGVPST